MSCNYPDQILYIKTFFLHKRYRLAQGEPIFPSPDDKNLKRSKAYHQERDLDAAGLPFY
jgi:hypothetical protein